MRLSRIGSGFALAATACTSASPTAQFTADDERAIRALDSVFVAAWLRDDTTAVMTTLAPDAVLMPARTVRGDSVASCGERASRTRLPRAASMGLDMIAPRTHRPVVYRWAQR